MSKILERTRALQVENNKLSRALSEAAGQTALMFERIIMVRTCTGLELGLSCHRPYQHHTATLTDCLEYFEILP